jgi:hypothetical protein
VRDRVALEEVAGCLREINASHRWMLPVGRVSYLPAITEAGFRPRGRHHRRSAPTLPTHADPVV